MRVATWGPRMATLLLLGIGHPGAAAVRCTDGQAIATARVQVAAACPCSGSRAAYRRCVVTTLAGLVHASQLVPDCAAAARRCAAASTCGRPGAVTCCTSRGGQTRCRVRRSANACSAHGGAVKTCPSCCDACGTTCIGDTAPTSTTSTTTTSLPTIPCDMTGFPQCGGSCSPGLVCQAMAVTGGITASFCQCVPDDLACNTAPSGLTCVVGRCPLGQACSGFVFSNGVECSCLPIQTSVTTTTSTTIPGQLCGDTTYPVCGGVCPSGDVCQATLWSGLQDRTFCDCVPADGSCSTISGGASCNRGPCPAGSACETFTFQGGVECGCLPTVSTTLPGGTTTTSTTVPPRGPCAPADCAGGCQPTQVCQAVWVTGSSTFNLCLCVDAGSSCDASAGTCPGACPAGRTCGDQFDFATGTHTGCSCLP